MSPTTAQLLYAVFALGGAALYLLLPSRQPTRPLAGVLLGLLAVAAWLGVLAVRVVIPGESTALFYILSSLAILGTARVITHRRPFYSAIYFVLVVIAVAALLLLQGAEFLAAALVIIYAGAILVTYLFLIMLAQQSGAPTYDRRAREPFLAVLAGFVLMAAVAGHAQEPPSALRSTTLTSAAESASPRRPGNTAAIGTALMTQYVVALQLSGVLLLISMAGAVALSRKKVPREAAVWETLSSPLGQAGREAGPF